MGKKNKKKKTSNASKSKQSCGTNNVVDQKEQFPTEEEFTKSFIIFIGIVIFCILFTFITYCFLLLNPLLTFLQKGIYVLAGTPIVILYKELKGVKLNRNKIFKKLRRNTLKKKIVFILTLSLSLSIIFFSIPTVEAWVIKQDNKIIELVKAKINGNYTEIIENDVSNNFTDTIIPSYNTNFIINHSDYSDNLNYTIISQAYLYNINDYDILGYFNELYQSNISVPTTSIYNEIQENEDIFLNKVEIANNYKEKNGATNIWCEMLPCENDLLNIIFAQENYAEYNPSFLVYSRLSNNYQRLALEYICQNSNETTINYYYCKSLMCDYKSIEYANTMLEYNTALNRIYYRYQDIYTNCELSDSNRDLLQLFMEQLQDYQ